MLRTLFTEDHELFRDTVRRFVEREVVPHRERWEEQGRVDRALFEAAGAAGILGVAVPEQYGGGGESDFRYNMLLWEELAAADAMAVGLGLSLQIDIGLPYFLHGCTRAQAERWLPDIASGKAILALAITEPGAGSDVANLTSTATLSGAHYVLNGAKTFITNGQNADLVVVAAKTDPSQGRRGISLLVVEADREGFSRGRQLAKVGQPAADTSELFFDDVRVPVENLLSEEGRGFYTMMQHLPQERLAVAVQAVAQARRSLETTVAYAKERRAFGQPIGSFQHNRFVLAELKTEVDIAQVYLDHCVMAHVEDRLDPTVAAQLKWWTTELCQKVVDRCLQLHGGYGYMKEYPIARAWADSRIQTIYAGTTEVMKDIIGRHMGL